MQREQRRLAAIVSADVAGYSRLMEADEAGTLAAFKRHREELIEPKVRQFGGRIVGSAGDGLLIEFGSVVDAVQCAVEVQQGMDERNAGLEPSRRMELRVGVNLGDVIVDGTDIHGDGVNVAARLQQMAASGGVCVAGTVREHVTGKLPYVFEDAGEHQVKNIARAVHVFRLRRERAGATATPAFGSDALPLPSKPSVAVLPFTNMSGDPEQEYFSDGITEDIITELSRNRGLFVIARNSSFTFKGPAVDIAEVGRKLGVRYVVEGSVRKAGKRIRITAQLVEAATGNHVWAERYDREIEDIFAVQDEVTERIVWALAGNVRVAEIDRTRRRRTEHAGSYDYLLRGIEAFYRHTRKDTAEAVDHFQKAVDLDPSSAQAVAWLARALGWAAGFEEDPERDKASRQATRRLLEMGDPDGHGELERAVECWWDGEHEAAESHLERALAKGAHDPQILIMAGFIRLWQGRIEEARSIGERLHRLDPLNPRWVHELLAFVHYLRGDYGTSLESFRRWGSVETQRSLANLAACLAQLGRIDEAKATLQRANAATPGFTVDGYFRGSPYRRREDLDRWLDGLRKAGVEI
jgi:TolB-like protein/Flp pilus assembly protein TadD